MLGALWIENPNGNNCVLKIYLIENKHFSEKNRKELAHFEGKMSTLMISNTFFSFSFIYILTL